MENNSLDFYKKTSNKKPFIIIAILLLIIILSVIGIYLYFNNKLPFLPKQRNITELPDIPFFIKCQTPEEEPCTTEYVLQLNNQTIRKGELKQGLNEFSTKYNGTYKTYYWDENHYLETDEFEIRADKQNIIELIQDSNNEIGILDVKHSENRLIIKTNATIKKLEVCFAWSIGILDINPNLEEKEIPEKYHMKVDKCYKIANEFREREKTIYLNIKTMAYVTETDFIKATFIDQERKLFGSDLIWLYETNQEDIGMKDFEYTIKLIE
ncbi:hypothetical protein KY312_04535 [Candidatus Woesearchaeota archaeon]|nr:hypothetical protein [Candidatus Woesearchaeota archaeon]